MTIKDRTKFAIVYPGDNEPFTRIQGLNPSSTCIPLQGETSFRSLFTGQTSYLLGLSGPHPLDSYRVETQSRLGVNQTLSLTQVVETSTSHVSVQGIEDRGHRSRWSES